MLLGARDRLDLEALAILAGEELVGLAVVDEALGLAIELELTADAIRDVGQVRE